jgi:exosortase
MRKFNHHIHNKYSSSIHKANHAQLNNNILILLTVFLILLLVWSYWSTIKGLYNLWDNDDDNSVGQLVPIVALFFLWRDRNNLKNCQLVPCWWAGIALLLLAQFIRIFGLLSFRSSLERYSLIIMLAGTVLLTAGWQVFKKVSWILLFLFLMVPLPRLIHNLISGPLQKLATIGTVFCLEAFGIEVVHEGNIIMLNGTIPMGIAEACNGLRMLISFIIVTAFITYLVKCSRPRKVVLMLSSIPIALICNIVRLCLTAAAMLIISVEAGQKFFHDFAGLSMMPIAVLLLFVELWVMDRIYEPRAGKQKKKAVENSRQVSKIKPVNPNNSKKSRKIVIAKD